MWCQTLIIATFVPPLLVKPRILNGTLSLRKRERDQKQPKDQYTQAQKQFYDTRKVETTPPGIYECLFDCHIGQRLYRIFVVFSPNMMGLRLRAIPLDIS